MNLGCLSQMRVASGFASGWVYPLKSSMTLNVWLFSQWAFVSPGTGDAGDLPPRPECAPAWREKLVRHLRNLKLTMVIGQYAQAYYLPDAGSSVTNVVQSWQKHWPNVVPLPHPSPRNNMWLRRNPWFEAELLPFLRDRVKEVLKDEN